MPLTSPPARRSARQLAAATGCAAALLGLTGCGSSSSDTGLAGRTATASTSTADARTASSAANGAAISRAAVQTKQGIPYAASSPKQTLDLSLPVSDGSKPVPVVVLIHGGAFMMGDSSMEAKYAQELAAQGFAVAAVNYRLSGEAAYPAGAQDVKAAVRWLRAHAGEYGLDVTKFGAWGQSAGGWMANMLGATGDQATLFDDPALGNADQSSAVQAVVSWFGPTNFATMDAQAKDVTACGSRSQVHGTADSPESRWLGGAVDSSAQTASTNVSAYVPKAKTLPEWYFAHGDSDCNVPAGQSAELNAALTKAGAKTTNILLTGAGHADAQFDRTQLEPTITFLKQVLTS